MYHLHTNEKKVHVFDICLPMAKYTIDKEGAPVQIPEELRRKDHAKRTVSHQLIQTGFDPTGTTEARRDVFHLSESVSKSGKQYRMVDGIKSRGEVE